MLKSEIKTLKNKKRKEGKSEKQIQKEIDQIEYSQIMLKNQEKELKKLREDVVPKLEDRINKLKKENFNLGLKNKPITIREYYDIPFPKENELRRVKLVMKSEEKPMTINEIKDIAYGLKLGSIRDCLMILYFRDELVIKKDKFSLKN